MSKNYRKGDYRRQCFICGRHTWFSEMRYIGMARYVCKDEPGLEADMIAKINARVKPLIVRPHRHAMPPTQVPTYQFQEAQIFQLVLGNGLLQSNTSILGAGPTVTSGQRLGACAVYLSDIINQGERPANWITRATAGLRSFADAILALQYGTPAGPSPSESPFSVLYGGILDTATSFTVIGQTYCGIALLRAHALFGDGKYLDAANAAASFLRALQRRDALVASPLPSYLGGFADSLGTDKVGSTRFSTSGAFALWFMTEMRAVVGGSAGYGLAAPAGDFALGTAATLDTMATDARDFYAGGRVFGWSTAPTSGTFGPLAPLSAATPREYYDASAGLFALRTISTFAESVTGLSFALGLRGLYEYEGYSAAVASVYEWLMSFTANPAAEYAA